MITGAKYNDLPAPAYVDVINHIDGTNEDIISVLEKNYRPSAAQAKNFAQRFKGSSRKEIAFNVWKFLKDNVRYKADGRRQKIKYISRLLADGVGDCKSFTLAEASILKHFMPIGFRYVSYSNNRTPSHVYLIAKDESGNVFPVDAVWNEFGTEKNFTYKIDNWMTVESLTGIESVFSQDEIKLIRNRIHLLLAKRNEYAKGSSTWQKITERARQLHTALQNDDVSILKTISGIGKGGKERRKEHRDKQGSSNVKKIALAPGRLAFLGLVKLNARGFAKKLSKISPEVVKAKWKKIGGNPDKLMKAIDTGKKKKALLGESKKNKNLSGYYLNGGTAAAAGAGTALATAGAASGGTVFAAIGAALAAAAPVISAIAKILPKGDNKEGDPSIEDILNEAGDNGGDVTTDVEDSNTDITDKGNGADHAGGFLADIPTPVKIIGGVGIAYLAYKVISKK